MLPIKFILIETVQFKGILKVGVKPIAAELRLEYSLHAFKGNQLTQSIRESLHSNSSNEAFFKALPIEQIFSHSLSLYEAEMKFVQICNNLTHYNNGGGTAVSPKLPHLEQLYLDNYQTYSLYTIFKTFTEQYEFMKMNLQVLKSKEVAVQSAPQLEEETDVQKISLSSSESLDLESCIIIDTEEQLSDEIILFNDIIKMSPTPIATYYISKFISNTLSKNKYETVNFEYDDNNKIVYISIHPMISTPNEFLNEYYKGIVNILNSFDKSQDEYISKLKMICNQLIYIINSNYGKTDNNKLFLCLKVLEFLIYIYSLKLSPGGLLNSLNLDNGKIVNTTLVNDILIYVNYSINYIMRTCFDTNQVGYVIQFKHTPVAILDDEALMDVQHIKTLLAKELYLLDIDKQNFLDRVCSKINKETKPKLGTPKLVLTKGSILNIQQYIDNDIKVDSWLSYSIIIPTEKQFEKHKIITQEYYDVLKLINAPSIITTAAIKRMHPVIARYAEIISQNIFHSLGTLDTKNIVSTLYLLNDHVRPFLNQDSTVDTELFILFRIVIPHLYDNHGITKFMDYLH